MRANGPCGGLLQCGWMHLTEPFSLHIEGKERLESMLDELKEETVDGYAALFSTMGRVFTLEPSRELVESAVGVAFALGVDWEGRFTFGPSLEQRFLDRTMVGSSPYFVALSENCIQRGAWCDEAFSYGSTTGALSDHVIACYESAGFDHRLALPSWGACPAFMPDSLGCECLFLSFLLAGQRGREQCDCGKAIELTEKFVSLHLGRWVESAACLLERSDEDFYAHCARLLCESLLM